MKVFIPLMIASAVLISACDNAAENNTAVSSDNNSSVVQNYKCRSGETIAVTYPDTDSAKVSYKGEEYDMSIDTSGSGSRYVGGNLEWWTKGSGAGAEGTLFDHKDDGSTGDVIENCTAS